MFDGTMSGLTVCTSNEIFSKGFKGNLSGNLRKVGIPDYDLNRTRTPSCPTKYDPEL